MEENSPLLAPPRFYFGVCGYCQNPGNTKAPLKRCSRCQNMFYCSSLCQKNHWKTHKYICKYLSEATVQGELENFFSGHQNDSRAEWNQFRMNAVKTCSVILSRDLSPEEQSIFLFPRVCRTTGCFSPVPEPGQEKMLECRDCLAAVWCRDQCREKGKKRHREMCRELRMARIADRYESQVKVGIPALPSHLDTEYMGTAPDITHFLETPLESKEIGSQELEFAFLTNHLSGPLTLLDCGHK